MPNTNLLFPHRRLPSHEGTAACRSTASVPGFGQTANRRGAVLLGCLVLRAACTLLESFTSVILLWESGSGIIISLLITCLCFICYSEDLFPSERARMLPVPAGAAGEADFA
jgi:hypothetical protein